VLCCTLLFQARLLELLGRLLELPTNLDFLLSCGQLLPAFVRSTRVALDHCNSLEADEPSMMTGGEAASRLSMLLQVGTGLASVPAEHGMCVLCLFDDILAKGACRMLGCLQPLLCVE
jgi:hypothetical protein